MQNIQKLEFQTTTYTQAKIKAKVIFVEHSDKQVKLRLTLDQPLGKKELGKKRG